MKRKVLALGLVLLMFGATGITSFASDNVTVCFTESNTLEYRGVTRDGEKVDLGTAFHDVVPGETREQVITLKNENKQTADFYLSAEVLKALEASKDTARGAGYDIKLVVEYKGKETVLYDSTVGGYTSTDAASADGISEMNGALNDYVLVSTMKEGETSDVVLSIAFDGEAMDNAGAVDYSLTDGQLEFDFKVGYEDPTGPKIIVKEITKKGEDKIVKKVVKIIEDRIPLGAPQTGDDTMIALAAIVLLVGSSLIILGKKKKGEGEHESQ